MVIPVIVTLFPTPMDLLANVAVAAEWFSVTVSLASTPDKAADDLTRRAVAEVVRSYTRPLAVMPVTVNALEVMVPVSDGCVSA